MRDTFYSFSTNYEDLVIAYALRKVPSNEIFWIDVGANDPVCYSNTIHFAMLGGRGINCEPLPYNFELQKKYRPNDENLNIAVSDRNCTMQITDSDSTSHLTDKRTRKTIDCTVKTAKDAFAEYAGKDVHFCSVDVEGHELAVLKGWDFSAVKPWLFCLESYGETEKALRDILEAKGYTFVFRDDANIFLVSEDHKDIAEEMKTASELIKEYDVVQITQYIDYVRSQARNTYSFKIGYALTQPVRAISKMVHRIGK